MSRKVFEHEYIDLVSCSFERDVQMDSKGKLRCCPAMHDEERGTSWLHGADLSDGYIQVEHSLSRGGIQPRKNTLIHFAFVLIFLPFLPAQKIPPEKI